MGEEMKGKLEKTTKAYVIMAIFLLSMTAMGMESTALNTDHQGIPLPEHLRPEKYLVDSSYQPYWTEIKMLQNKLANADWNYIAEYNIMNVSTANYNMVARTNGFTSYHGLVKWGGWDTPSKFSPPIPDNQDTYRDMEKMLLYWPDDAGPYQWIDNGYWLQTNDFWQSSNMWDATYKVTEFDQGNPTTEEKDRIYERGRYESNMPGVVLFNTKTRSPFTQPGGALPDETFWGYFMNMGHAHLYISHADQPGWGASLGFVKGLTEGMNNFNMSWEESIYRGVWYSTTNMYGGRGSVPATPFAVARGHYTNVGLKHTSLEDKFKITLAARETETVDMTLMDGEETYFIYEGGSDGNWERNINGGYLLIRGMLGMGFSDEQTSWYEYPNHTYVIDYIDEETGAIHFKRTARWSDYTGNLTIQITRWNPLTEEWLSLDTVPLWYEANARGEYNFSVYNPYRSPVCTFEPLEPPPGDYVWIYDFQNNPYIGAQTLAFFIDYAALQCTNSTYPMKVEIAYDNDASGVTSMLNEEVENISNFFYIENIEIIVMGN